MIQLHNHRKIWENEKVEINILNKWNGGEKAEKKGWKLVETF